MGIDALLHFYLVITMIIKQTSSATASIITSFIQIPVATYTQVTVLCLLLGVFVAIFVAMLAVIVSTHSLGTLNKMQGVKRVLTAVFLGLMTCLQLPIMEVVLSIAFIDFGSQGGQVPIRIGLYFLASINGLVFLAIIFMLQKLFIIRIPSIQVHWAASNTQLHSMKTINKLVLVICHLYITTINEQSLLATIPLFLLFLGTGVSRIMLIPHYRLQVEWYTRMTELITACLLLVLIVGQFEVQNSETDLNICLLVSIVALPSILGFSLVLDHARTKVVWTKLERNELKHEIEWEHGLYLLIEKVKTAMGSDDASALAFSDVLYMVDKHNRHCKSNSCACHRRQIVQYVLNKGFNYGLKRLLFDDEEIALLNAAGQNAFIKSSRVVSGVKMLTQFQQINFYAAASGSIGEEHNPKVNKNNFFDVHKKDVDFDD